MTEPREREALIEDRISAIIGGADEAQGTIATLMREAVEELRRLRTLAAPSEQGAREPEGLEERKDARYWRAEAVRYANEVRHLRTRVEYLEWALRTIANGVHGATGCKLIAERALSPGAEGAPRHDCEKWQTEGLCCARCHPAAMRRGVLPEGEIAPPGQECDSLHPHAGEREREELGALREFFAADHAVLLALADYHDAHRLSEGPMLDGPALDAVKAAYARQVAARETVHALAPTVPGEREEPR